MINAGECVATAEAHDDRMWALDVAGDGDSAVMTGAGDGTLALWADCTATDKAKQREEQDVALQHQQVCACDLSVNMSSPSW